MNHKKFYLLFALMGFSAIVAQILILRRFIVVFSGNELTVGIVLACWLFFAGVGHFIAGSFADRLKNIHSSLGVSLILFAVFIPSTIIAAGCIKVILGIKAPDIVSIGTILASSAAVMAPLSIAVGASLTIASRMIGSGRSHDIGYVYLWDAVGAALGGIVFGWVAIRYLSPVSASFIASLLVLSGVFVLWWRRMYKWLAFLVFIFFAVLLVISPKIERWITNIEWSGFNVVESLDSKFGNIIVTENEGEHTLFVDGIPAFSSSGVGHYEAISHVPMVEQKNPRDVLIVGGGLKGLLAQFRKYKLDSITYLQIDPDVTRLEEKWFGGIDTGGVNVKFVDGRHYLKYLDAAKCEGGCFDIIELNVGDPESAAINRYYTVEFFELAKRALRPDGILFFGIFQPGNYIGPEAAELLGTIYATLKSVFPYVVILPLDQYYFVASAETGRMTDDIDELAGRIKKSGVATSLLLNVVLYGIYPERVESFRNTIVRATTNIRGVNTDNRPSAFYYGLALWGSLFGEEANKFFRIARRIDIKYVLSGLVVILAASFLVWGRRSSGRVILKSFWILFVVGFAGIAYEILVLISYQTREGYLFYRIGLIVTAFMVGLGLGAYAGIIFVRRFKYRNFGLLISLILFLFYISALFIVCRLSPVAANLGAALFSGFIYQLMAEEMILTGRGVGFTSSIICGADNIGATIGSLLISILLIPIFGLKDALFVILIVVAMALLIQVIIGDRLKNFIVP